MALNETHCLILYVDMRLYKVFIVKINMLECTGVFYQKMFHFLCVLELVIQLEFMTKIVFFLVLELEV